MSDEYRVVRRNGSVVGKLYKSRGAVFDDSYNPVYKYENERLINLKTGAIFNIYSDGRIINVNGEQVGLIENYGNPNNKIVSNETPNYRTVSNDATYYSKTNIGTKTLSEAEYMKEFLRRATDIEYARFMMEQYIKSIKDRLNNNRIKRANLNNSIEGLSNHINYLRGSVTSNVEQIRKNKSSTQSWLKKAIIVGIVLVVIAMLFYSSLASSHRDVYTAIVLQKVLLLVVPFVIVFFVVKSKDNKNNMKSSNNYRASVDNQVQSDNRQIQKIKKDISTVEVEDRLLDKELIRCESELSKFNYQRERFYSDGLLPVKYREVVPCAMMLEYFENRLCFVLDGPDGAMSRFETQIRLDQIVDTVERISRQLSTVINNQSQILNRVESIDGKINDVINSIENNTQRIINNQNEIGSNISSQLDRIAYNTEMSKFYDKTTAQASQYLLWKEGVSYNKFV